MKRKIHSSRKRGSNNLDKAYEWSTQVASPQKILEDLRNNTLSINLEYLDVIDAIYNNRSDTLFSQVSALFEQMTRAVGTLFILSDKIINTMISMVNRKTKLKMQFNSLHSIETFSFKIAHSISLERVEPLVINSSNLIALDNAVFLFPYRINLLPREISKSVSSNKCVLYSEQLLVLLTEKTMYSFLAPSKINYTANTESYLMVVLNIESTDRTVIIPVRWVINNFGSKEQEAVRLLREQTREGSSKPLVLSLFSEESSDAMQDEEEEEEEQQRGEGGGEWEYPENNHKKAKTKVERVIEQTIKRRSPKFNQIVFKSQTRGEEEREEQKKTIESKLDEISNTRHRWEMKNKTLKDSKITSLLTKLYKIERVVDKISNAQFIQDYQSELSKLYSQAEEIKQTLERENR